MVRLWDLRRQQQIGAPLPSPKIVQSVAFSPDGRMLATGSGDFKIRLWDVATHRELGPPLGNERAPCIRWPSAPTGKLLASGNSHGLIQFWNVASHQPVGQPVSASPPQPVEAVAFSPNGNLLASGSGDAEVRLWDASSHRLIARLSGHQATVTSVAFSPDGSVLASGSTDGTVKLWSVQSREQLASLTSPDWVEGVAFSPDGRTLAVGSADGTVQLWDVASRRALGLPLTSHTPLLSGHAASINAVAFSPKGIRARVRSPGRNCRGRKRGPDDPALDLPPDRRLPAPGLSSTSTRRMPPRNGSRGDLGWLPPALLAVRCSAHSTISRS